MAATPILDALQDAAAANPEKARELLGQFKEQFDSLSPEEQQEAIGKLTGIRDQVAGLPEDQRAEIRRHDPREDGHDVAPVEGRCRCRAGVECAGPSC